MNASSRFACLSVSFFKNANRSVVVLSPTIKFDSLLILSFISWSTSSDFFFLFLLVSWIGTKFFLFFCFWRRYTCYIFFLYRTRIWTVYFIGSQQSSWLYGLFWLAACHRGNNRVYSLLTLFVLGGEESLPLQFFGCNFWMA